LKSAGFTKLWKLRHQKGGFIQNATAVCSVGKAN